MTSTIRLPAGPSALAELQERMADLAYFDADVGGRTITVEHGEHVEVCGLDDEPILRAQLHRRACDFADGLFVHALLVEE